MPINAHIEAQMTPCYSDITIREDYQTVDLHRHNLFIDNAALNSFGHIVAIIINLGVVLQDY